MKRKRQSSVQQPPEGLRERKKRELRERIFEMAIALFRKRGFENTNVEEIARRLDISLKTFFNYFPGKHAVLDEYALRILDEFDVQVRAALTQEATTARRLLTILKDIGASIEHDPEMALVVFRESKLFDADEVFREREQKTYQLLADLFREGQKRGELRDDFDATQMAEGFLALYYFTSINWLANWWRDKKRLSHRLQISLNMLLSGIEIRRPATR